MVCEQGGKLIYEVTDRQLWALRKEKNKLYTYAREKKNRFNDHFIANAFAIASNRFATLNALIKQQSEPLNGQ